MNTAEVISIYSNNFDELRIYFQGLEPPYTLRDIRGFNTIYGGLYPVLTREEKRRAEEFVDVMIAGVEKKEWACKIFGVV